VWQNIALCTISTFSLILAVQCLWDPEWANRAVRRPMSVRLAI
jgi:hypothetical protein